MKNEATRLNRIIISFVFLILSLIMLMPFFVMVSTSLKTPTEISLNPTALLPEKLTIANYQDAMARGSWFRWIFNSVLITSVVTVVSLLFNSLAGYSFSRLEYKGRNFLFFSTLLGLMIPHQVTMVPVFIMFKNFPLVGGNNLFGQGGTGLIDTYLGLMLPHMAGAFGVFLCRQFYLNFPKSLDEAAEIDGCSSWRTYFQIYLPLSKPLLASLGVLKLTSAWNDYLWPLILTNTTKMRTVQLAIAIFRNEVVEWNLLMAATTIITLPLIIVFMFAQRFFIEGITTSGMKA